MKNKVKELKDLKKGDYAKYVGESCNSFLRGKLYQLTRDYDNKGDQFIDETGDKNGFCESNQYSFVVPTKEELKEINKAKSYMKAKEVLITKIAKKTGYSKSHVYNVLSGRRHNDKIMSIAKSFKEKKVEGKSEFVDNQGEIETYFKDMNIIKDILLSLIKKPSLLISKEKSIVYIINELKKWDFKSKDETLFLAGMFYSEFIKSDNYIKLKALIEFQESIS